MRRDERTMRGRVMSWEGLGSLILELSEEAQRMREEERRGSRGTGDAPLLRLVRAEEREPVAHEEWETGSAA